MPDLLAIVLGLVSFVALFAFLEGLDLSLIHI